MEGGVGSGESYQLVPSEQSRYWMAENELVDGGDGSVETVMSGI